MTAQLTVDGPCRCTLNFSIAREELDSAVNSRLAEIAKTTEFKGFRKGKAPTSLVARAHGESAREEAQRKLMGEAFASAVKEHKLNPVGDPEMNLQGLNEGEEGPLTFEFAIEVAPEIDLKLPENFDVTVTLPNIDEGMIDGEVERLLERFGKIEEAPEEALVTDEAILEGTVVYVIDDVELEPRSERPAFTKHDLVDGLRIEGSQTVFEGAKVSDTVDLAVELPDHFDPAEHAGKSATLRYTIDRHRLVVLPDLDEELLKNLGQESVEELRGNIRTGLDGQRQAAYDEQVNAGIENSLLDAHVFDLPERLEARSIDRQVHQVAHRMVDKDGLSSEEGHSRAEEQREQISDGTRRGLRLAFIYGHIADLEDLKASVEEALAQVRSLAQQQGKDPDESVQSAIQEGWFGDVQEQLSNDKVRTWLRERAKVTEQEPPAADAA
ncbi:MAG: trigger factor [Pseudohongiellaceae bacterium]|jgi:trigger factor